MIPTPMRAPTISKKIKGFSIWILPKIHMEKPLIFLLIVGALIGVGIILSFYGAQLATQNLTVKEENLDPGSSMEVIVELDPSIGETGVVGIGYMPDRNTLSIGIVGFYILVVGLIGMGGIGVYTIRNRRKEKFN